MFKERNTTLHLFPIPYRLFPPRHELVAHVQADGGHIEERANKTS